MRHGLHEGVAGQQPHGLVCSASSPDFACRNHTRSPICSVARPVPVSGVCTSPAPSSPVRWRPGGAHGTGARSLARSGPTGDEAAAGTVAIAGGGAADDRQPEEGGGPRVEGLVVVEEARAPAAPSPAAISVTAGSAAVASTVPEPPAFQNSSSARSASAARDLGPPLGELRHRRRLEAAYDERLGPLAAARRRARRPPGPRRSSPRPARSRRAGRRAWRQRDDLGDVVQRASAWARRAGRPSRSPASMSMATRTGRRVGSGPRRSASSWATSSTISVTAARAAWRRRPAPASAARSTVG